MQRPGMIRLGGDDLLAKGPGLLEPAGTQMLRRHIERRMYWWLGHVPPL
jgi:hypothetical protein